MDDIESLREELRKARELLAATDGASYTEVAMSARHRRERDRLKAALQRIMTMIEMAPAGYGIQGPGLEQLLHVARAAIKELEP